MLKLTSLKPKSRKRSRRIGRGNGSGRGTFSGRGMKGQRARSGSRGGLKLRGLRTLFKAIPKNRGFNSLAPDLAVMNLSELDRKTVKVTLLKLPRTKILGVGEISRAVTVEAAAFSASAKAKIEHAGGKAITCGKLS
jgi:large subunit ribosomal protein L15